MFSAALNLFLLRKLAFERFAFPRYLSVLVITFYGGIFGFDLIWEHSGIEILPLLGGFTLYVAIFWGFYVLLLAMLEWSMKQDPHWDGQGELFNLVVSASIVPNTLFFGLTIIEADLLIHCLLGFYSLGVLANELSGAIPKASLAYSMVSIVMSMFISFSLSAGLLISTLLVMGFPIPLK